MAVNLDTESQCRLQRAETIEEVLLILKDPEIFGRVAEDGIEIDDYMIPMDGQQCYMMIHLEDIPIGVWLLYPVNGSTLNIHCHVLKPYRSYGIIAGNLIIEWFVNEAPKQYVKLNAEIPVIHPEVYHFTKKFGFIDEGINRLSIKKNGKIIDQWRLGLTKSEATNFLGGANE